MNMHVESVSPLVERYLVNSAGGGSAGAMNQRIEPSQHSNCLDNAAVRLGRGGNIGGNELTEVALPLQIMKNRHRLVVLSAAVDHDPRTGGC